MKDLILSEFQRTFKRKKTIVAFVLYGFVLLFECFFLYQMDVSFYDPEHPVILNSINTAPFLMRELGLFLHFILIPMLVIDSFNGEYTSGAYRLVLIRPQSRIKLLFSKWIVLGTIFFGITMFTWLCGTVFGMVFMPFARETAFYQTGTMNIFQGLLYTLLFYLLAFFILIAVIGLCSLICIIMPNPILSFTATVIVLVGGIYINDVFDYLFVPSDTLFKAMGEFQVDFFISLFLIIVISYIINIALWKKKQWMR